LRAFSSALALRSSALIHSRVRCRLRLVVRRPSRTRQSGTRKLGGYSVDRCF
jgi:hypothetical protein